MRRRGEHGVLLLTILFFFAFFFISMCYFGLSQDVEHVRTARENAMVTIHAGDSYGTVYDRNFVPMTNSSNRIMAVVVPSAVSLEDIAPLAADPVKTAADYGEGKPFVMECSRKCEESAGLTFFDVPERYSGDSCAVHTVGYMADGSGVAGIEYAYDLLLRTGAVENSVTYTTDGFGHIMIGEDKSVIRSIKEKSGVVLTIDSSIQRICVEAGKSIEKGAVVVSDIRSGDILAMASFPDYDINDIASALNDERCPMINRALYSYSVGSVFKLVTAAHVIDSDFSGYIYNCTGSCQVGEQRFNCHKAAGHGVQDMTAAITNSCNTWFIAASQCLDAAGFRDLAFSLGFGREIHLCAGMISSAGVLPTAAELSVPAELANFSFGQGKLTATPLQVNQLTCTIANGGELPMLRIVRGITVDGETVGNEKAPRKSRVMAAGTSEELRRMMFSAIYSNRSSNAAPSHVQAAAKTSTAQTGRFDKNGDELCHGWITGFFPVTHPKYAVTVLVEDGGYGNDSAAPVFADIIDGIWELS